MLPLWVADMDFAAPPVVLEAIRARLDHGVLGYSRAHPGLNDTVLAYLFRPHGIDAAAAWIEWLPGLVPAKSMACRASARRATRHHADAGLSAVSAGARGCGESG